MGTSTNPALQREAGAGSTGNGETRAPACRTPPRGAGRLAWPERTGVRTTGRREGGGVRVLGIDPGLTRCGVGVVDGSVGRPLTMVDVGVIRTSASLPVAERLVTIETRPRRLDRGAPTRCGRRRAGLRPLRLQHHHGHRPGQRDRARRRRAQGAADRHAHPQRGQGRRVRQRSRRQGPGRRDGRADPAPDRDAQARRRRRRPRPRHHPRLARLGQHPDRGGRGHTPRPSTQKTP